MNDVANKIPNNGAPIRVLAVIPTLGKNIERLNRAIRSMREHSNQHETHLVVVDNSQLGSLKGMDPVDEVLRYGLNLGWVGSIEAVRRRYRFEYLWTIQDDMTFANDVLGILLRDLESTPSLGVSTPVSIVNGLVPAFSRGGVLDSVEKLMWSNIPKEATPPEQVVNPSNLCFVSGSGALWRGSALESAGGFGANLYPLVHVDVDMCFRLQKFGWKLNISNQAHVEHAVRGSTSSLLGQTLASLNQEMVRHNYANFEHTPDEDHLILDQELLFEIASKASYLLLELGQEGTKRIEAAEAQLELWRRRPIFQMFVSSKLYQRMYGSYTRLINSPNQILGGLTKRIGIGMKRVLGITPN